LFAKKGFAATGTEEIVQRAGVTRGALYYHFRDKQDLFRAVDEEVEADLADKIATAALAKRDPWARLAAGCNAYLDASFDPAVRRIVLIDAPSVLGWEGWRAIDAKYGMGLLEGGLQAAMDVGAIASQPVTPLAHLLLAALSEACMVIAHADDGARARNEMGASVTRLLEGLRTKPGRAYRVERSH
jgi:AcrR family transcriptional regulator